MSASGTGRSAVERLRERVRVEYEARLEKMKPEHQAKVRDVLSWPYWWGNLGPDAARYTVAHQQAVPRPYHYRWLIPKLCQGDRRKFTVVTYGSLLGMVPAMRWYTGRWEPGLFLFGLPGVWHINRYCPYLADPPAMLAAIVSAAAVKRGQWGLGIVASLVGGATKETAPLFAALYAWNPLPLIGLIAPALQHLKPAGEDLTDAWLEHSHYVLEHPFETAYDARVGQAKNWRLWVAPWGALLLGLRADPQTVATVGTAYGQLLGATDNERLYQWAWPVLARNTVEATDKFSLAALVAHLVNPWKGSGG